MTKNFRHTSVACYLGYVTQALIITFPSLLFTVFFNKFNINLSELGILIIITFIIQLLMDLLSATFVNKTGYRMPAVIAHLFSFLGLVLLAILPNIMPSHRYIAVSVPIFISSIGGGLIEVLISPIMEGLPNEKKAKSMSFLHSFFCWGQLGTVLLSTLYFYIAGIDKWYFLPVIWSLIPLFNMFYFMKVPLPEPEKGEKIMGVKKLLSTKFFFFFLLLMLCSGAAEQAMSQWASLFAETGLGVSKTTGDILGLSFFATLMGVARLYYGIKGKGENLSRLILYSGILCVFSYLLTVFSPYPVLSLVGCALTGLSVGIMWPGAISIATEHFDGGTAMFALLAFSGDLGCSLGPGLVGIMSDWFGKGIISLPFFSGDIVQQGLKFGLMIATVFPILLVFAIVIIRQRKKKGVH